LHIKFKAKQGFGEAQARQSRSAPSIFGFSGHARSPARDALSLKLTVERCQGNIPADRVLPCERSSQLDSIVTTEAVIPWWGTTPSLDWKMSALWSEKIFRTWFHSCTTDRSAFINRLHMMARASTAGDYKHAEPDTVSLCPYERGPEPDYPVLSGNAGWATGPVCLQRDAQIGGRACGLVFVSGS